MPQLDTRFEVFVLEEPGQPLYRGCQGRDGPAIEAAMRSNYEAGRSPHPLDLRATVLHMAVSLFEDLAFLERMARRRPERIGTHIARVDLKPGGGVCLAKTGGPGHWSVWAVPARLAAWVVDVEEVRK